MLNLIMILFAFMFNWSVGSIAVSYLLNAITISIIAIFEFFYLVFIRRDALKSTFKNRTNPPRTHKSFVEDFFGFTLSFCFSYAIIFLFFYSAFRPHFNTTVFIFAVIYFISQTVLMIIRAKSDTEKHRILSEEAIILVPHGYLVTLALILLLLVPLQNPLVILFFGGITDVYVEVLSRKYRYQKVTN